MTTFVYIYDYKVTEVMKFPIQRLFQEDKL
jgi:hypothetical protein